jgi:hypothetical protein
MWWMDLLFGFWNGITAWIVFIVHVFGGWSEFPLYDVAKSGGWYDFGFLIGVGSPLFGAGSSRRVAADASAGQRQRGAVSQGVPV